MGRPVGRGWSGHAICPDVPIPGEESGRRRGNGSRTPTSEAEGVEGPKIQRPGESDPRWGKTATRVIGIPPSIAHPMGSQARAGAGGSRGDHQDRRLEVVRPDPRSGFRNTMTWRFRNARPHLPIRRNGRTCRRFPRNPLNMHRARTEFPARQAAKELARDTPPKT